MIIYRQLFRRYAAFRYHSHLKMSRNNFVCYQRHYFMRNIFDSSRRCLNTDHRKCCKQPDVELLLGDKSPSNVELDQISVYHRNVLYQDTDDEIIKKLKSCQSSAEILKIIDSCEFFSPQQLVLAVLALRDFLRFTESTNENATPDYYTIYHDFNDVIKSESFEKLVNSVVQHSSKMDLDEISCCLLYLQRLGAPDQSLMILTEKFEDMLRNMNDENVSVSSLSRVCTMLKNFSNIWSFYTYNNLQPVIFRKFDACCDFDTFSKITICFLKMVPSLTIECMHQYIAKCQMLLEKSNEKEVEIARIRAAVKACLLLDLKKWDGEFLYFQKQLLLTFCGNVKYLDITDLCVLTDLTCTTRECYPVRVEIRKTVADLFSQPKEIQDEFKSYYLLPRIKVSREEKLKLKKYIFEKPFIFPEFYCNLSQCYSAVVDTEEPFSKELSAMYWSRAVKYFKHFPILQSVDKLTWMSLKYLNFCASKKLFNANFEKEMLSWFRALFRDEQTSVLSPKDYVKVGLLIVFFQRSVSSITVSMWNRILDNISRLDPSDLTVVSYILNVTVQRMEQCGRFSQFLQHYIYIVSAIDSNSFQYLCSQKDISLGSLILILNGFRYREGTKASPLFDLICDRLRDVPLKQINGKHICDYCFALKEIKHLEPQFADAMITYCTAEAESVDPFVFATILHHVFLFGYSPKNIDKFCNVLKEKIIRNEYNLNRKLIVKMALGMSYYSELPVELTDYIFNLKFLGQLDEEIQQSNKRKMVQQIRQNLMELNQVVCLEYPERDIPWFHEKYCKEKLAIESFSRSNFFVNVLEVLQKILPVKNSFSLNCFSPYHHKIDFLVNTNRKGEPVNPDTCSPSNLQRIALLLNHHSSTSDYFLGKGKLDRKIRQLELLDYKVVVICQRVWNSMYMSEPFAKENYLCSEIWS